MRGGQILDEGGARDAAFGVVQHAIDAREQFQAVEAAGSVGLSAGNSKPLQPQGRRHLAAAMNGNFDAIRESVERHIHAFAVAAKLRNGLAANVSGGPGQLRARFALEPGVDGKYYCPDCREACEVALADSDA